MRRRRSVLTALGLLFLLCACRTAGWRGFEKEDLTAYLTLGEYRGLTYTARDTSVSDGEVEAVILALREEHTALTPTEKPVEDGVTVTFDRFCFLNGVSTPSLSEEGETCRCGDDPGDPVVAALLDGMKGMTLGESAELTVTLPAGYRGEVAASCDAVYSVTVRALYEKEIPPLTDEIAAGLRAGVSTVGELTEAVRSELLAEKEAEASYRAKAQLWDKVMENSTLLKKPFDLYQERYTALYGMVEDLAAAASVSLSDYLAAQSQTIEGLEAQLMAQATSDVKEQLAFHEIAKREGIACTEGEIRDFAAQKASESGFFSSSDEYMEYYGYETVAENLLTEKVLDLILSSADPA